MGYKEYGCMNAGYFYAPYIDLNGLLNESDKVRHPDLDCGDLKIVDAGGLGSDFCRKDTGEKITFINQAAELAYLEWLQRKYPKGRKSDNVAMGLRE